MARSPPVGFLLPAPHSLFRIESAGWRLGFYTGYRRTSFDPFPDGLPFSRTGFKFRVACERHFGFSFGPPSPYVPNSFVSVDALTSSVSAVQTSGDIVPHCRCNPIAEFRSDWIAGPAKPCSYNGDLFMSRFESVSHIWDGGKRSIAFGINDATSDTGRVEQAARGPFRISDSTLHPPGNNIGCGVNRSGARVGYLVGVEVANSAT